MGKMSRDKGKSGERELARILRDEYGYSEARRGQQYQGGPDSPDVVGLPGLHIEVKRCERLSLYDAVAQAKADAAPEELPAVFHRRNHCEWLVIQELSAFMRIYSGYEAGQRLAERNRELEAENERLRTMVDDLRNGRDALFEEEG